MTQQATDETSMRGTFRTYAAGARSESVERPILPGGLSLPNGPPDSLPAALSQPYPTRLRGQLRPVTGTGLAQHGSGVLLDRLDGQHEPLGDELVRKPLFHQAPDLLLPFGQCCPWVVVSQPAMELLQHGAGQNRLAAGGRDDRPGEFRAVRAHVDAPARPGPHGAGDQLLVAHLAEPDHSE